MLPNTSCLCHGRIIYWYILIHEFPINNWLVVGPPLWKIWVRQLGWLATQYFWENKIDGNQTTIQIKTVFHGKRFVYGSPTPGGDPKRRPRVMILPQITTGFGEVPKQNIHIYIYMYIYIYISYIQIFPIDSPSYVHVLLEINKPTYLQLTSSIISVFLQAMKGCSEPHPRARRKKNPGRDENLSYFKRASQFLL